ncbi:YoaK family protein [Bradyrhizobium sp. UFLA05-109]
MAAGAQNRLLLPLLLSCTAGYVDTAGFLALQGLFTAHVTGNFVTLGASLVLGTSGAIAKLLALPVFCTVVIATRLLSSLLSHQLRAVFETMLGLEIALLVAGATLAVRFGPFRDGDSWQAIVTGMVLVAAMAIQNATHRIYLASVPPSTLMTGTTTQIMIDLADLALGRNEKNQPNDRLKTMGMNVLVFALGCGAAALLFMQFGVWCFVIPPILAALCLIARVAAPADQ